MKKIAIIFDGDLTSPKGRVNACLNRIKHLIDVANYDVDVFAVQSYENRLIRFLRKTKKRERLEELYVDGIKIKLLWIDFSLLDYLLVYRLKKRSIYSTLWYKKHIDIFKSYDIISAHTIFCGKFALAIHRKYKIPYFVTWHGSDIHTLPHNNKYNKIDTISVLENATDNFFVSKGLLLESERLTLNAHKRVLYNGVGDIFKRYSEDVRLSLRVQYGCSGKKVVAFVGNIISIKNALLLPEIFCQVRDLYKGDVIFWVIGDGKLRTPLQQKFDASQLDYKIWGNQPANLIPDFMNCVDVLVLPSKNESFGLVVVEALRCGANVVASNVGGIPEILSEENVFDLDDNFIGGISSRVVEMLEFHVNQPLSDIFSWKKTAELENCVYENYMQLM